MIDSRGKLCLTTYNIWNCDEGMPYRTDCILRELQKINADIICLQEVKNAALAKKIADRLGKSYYFVNYKDEEEGICILSAYPMIEKEDWICVNAQYIGIQYRSKYIGIANCHLPWDSVMRREKYICDIISKLNDKTCDYLFLLGDFNSGNNSDVFRFLLGECSLNQKEANPCFYDLASASAQIHGSAVKNTLDFRSNPRFFDNTIEVNQRFDRIFLRNTYPFKFPRLIECDIFGTEVYSESGLPASDHYGVYAVVESE